MAKRKAPNGGQSKAKNKPRGPLSATSKKKLSKELKNARSRIRALMNAQGTAYTGPAIEDFYLNNVLALIKNGTHINTIYAMAKNATAKKIRRNSSEYATRNNPIVAQAYGGAPVGKKEYSKLLKTLAKANKNIDKAKERFPGLDDIFPDYLTPENVLSKVTTTKRLEEVRKTIDSAFKPGKLVPTAINEDGEVGTAAEIEYLNAFILNENKQREIARNQLKRNLDERGFFMTQQEFDVKAIDTSSWDTIEKWRKRAEYFTDAKSLDKANIWLMNYITSFSNLLDDAIINNYPSDSKLFKYADEIFKLLRKLETPELVREATRYSPYFGIENFYVTPDELEGVIEKILWEWETFFGE